MTILARPASSPEARERQRDPCNRRVVYVVTRPGAVVPATR